MRVFGQVVSVAIVTVIFAAMLGSVVISQEVSEQLLNAQSFVFIILGLLCTIGVWFSYARGKNNFEETIV
jgi:hypothetical protein